MEYIKFSKERHHCYPYVYWCNIFKDNETSKKIGHNTWVRYNNGLIEFIYWSTIILTLDRHNYWTYNTGGWETFTTKRRFNVLGPAYIYQRDGLWFFEDHSHNRWKYYDNMVLNMKGEPIKEGPWLMS